MNLRDGRHEGKKLHVGFFLDPWMVYLSYTNLIRYTYIYIYIYLQYILYTLDLPLTQDAVETNEGLGVGISDPKMEVVLVVTGILCVG